MIEVADVLNKYGEAYRGIYKLPYHKLKVMRDIEQCRTAEMGGHVEKCTDCGHIRISYNSCRNRHCPKCQNIAKEKWLDNRKRDILPIKYFHVVFTIPKELNDLTLINKKEIYSLLFKSTSETLYELSKDKKYLGAEIGYISILHTWGQNLMYHPHIHGIVTGGGLSKDRQKWKSVKGDFFIPVKGLSEMFKGKFLDYLKELNKNKKLKFTGKIKSLSLKSEFQKQIDNLYRKDWVVYCKKPFKNAENVIEYLGRYTHRIAISNNRIINMNKDKVTFKWRDYKDKNKNKLMTITAFEFIRRFLLHVLPRRFVKIRHYGILSNRNRNKKLKTCKRLLKVKNSYRKEETWQELILRLTGIDYRKCPCCGNGKMKTTSKVLPKPNSPPGIGILTA